MNLMRKVAKLAIYIENKDERSKKVSKATVGWHIYHALLVINNVFNHISQSDPNDYVKKENKTREYVLKNKKIKRGVAQSPEKVFPPKEYSEKELKTLLKQTKQIVVQLDLLPKNSFFAHHNLGHLTTKEAVKFLSIHTKHHLKIIKEIINN